jgi:TetR/AcrR family transcriptional repressor of nem operon
VPRPRKFDEADAVAAARDEFWSRGYAATSVEDLTAATGLGKGSLYGAFGDKHSLFLRALDGYLASALDSVHAQLRDPKRSPYERLVRHIRGQAAAVAGDKGRRGCLMAKSAAELGSTDDEVADKVQRVLTAWRGELIDTIRAAQRDGSIDPDANAQALATALLALMRGLEALGKGGVKPAQIKAAGEEAVRLIPARAAE